MDFQKLKDNDETAWSEFYLEHFRIAFRAAACMTQKLGFGYKSMEVGPGDIAQEVLIAFHQWIANPNRKEEVKSPKGWILSAVWKKAYSYNQKAQAQKRGGKHFPVSMDKSVEGQDDSEGLNLHEVVGDFDLAAGNDGPQQFKQDVSEALNLLDPSDRDLLVDKYIVGLKQREMEEKYQKKSMGVVIRRALRRALNIFERNGFSPSYWSYPATTTQYIEEDESIYEDEAHDEALIVIKGNPDINGDGRVDLDDLREFRRIIKLMRDSNNGLKEEEKSQLDINGDGIVDERDFIALGMEVLRAGITPKDGAISLEKGDLNSDGKINQDDLDLLRLKLEAQEAGDSLPVEAVKLLDVNGDGRLDENDFIDLSLMVLANEVDEEREKGLMDLVQNNVLLKREFDLIEMDAKDFSKALNLDVIDDAAVEIPNGIETKLLADFLKKTAEEG